MSTAPEDMVGGVNKPSLVMKFARKYNIVEATLLHTLKQTAFKGEQEVSNEQMVALLVVADQYNLNPFTKEIYAYPDKHKGIVPVVSVDGWIRIVNEHPDYNGYDVILPEAMTQPTDDRPACWPWITILMHRRKVEHTPPLTEYLDECYREPYSGIDRKTNERWTKPGPWQSHPKRMLRHKAYIQAARAVFGFAGIYDEDEAARIVEAGARGVDATVVAEQGKSGTASAKDALKARLTDVRGTGGLQPASDAIRREMEAERVPAKTRGAEWDLEQKPAADQPTKPPFKYEIPTALAKLRGAASLDDLHAFYDTIQEDYTFSEREFPVDIEACYRELVEMKEGQAR